MEEAGIETKVPKKRGRKASSDAVSTKSTGSKRTPSAYNLFMKDPDIRAKATGDSAPEKMSSIAQMWKEADEETKRPFIEEAKRLKQTKNDSTESDRESETQSVTKRHNKMTPYKLFKKDHKDIGSLDEIKDAWKNADEETKEKYNTMAEEYNAKDGVTAPVPKVETPKKAPKTKEPQAPKKPKQPTKPQVPAVAPLELMEEVDAATLDAFAADPDCRPHDFPQWVSKKDTKKYYVNQAEGMVYHEDESYAGTVDAFGGPDAFYK